MNDHQVQLAKTSRKLGIRNVGRYASSGRQRVLCDKRYLANVEDNLSSYLAYIAYHTKLQPPCFRQHSS